MPHLLQMCHPYGVWLVFQWVVATNVPPRWGFWNVAFGPWGYKCATPMGFITFSYVVGCYKCATPYGVYDHPDDHVWLENDELYICVIY